MADKELDELFRRFVREHDVRAVGELFDAAAPQLARIAWHLTHDASGVEDLVQTTFLTALASAHEFAAERRVMPWLLRILLNHARNARRASERKPEPLAVDLVDPRTPESDLERRELHEVVQRAVADLPDTYREVVSTWLIEGATPTEIAHRTGKPAATVRVQLRRGLELLRSGLPAGVAGLLAPNSWSASSFAASREVVLAQAARVARTLAPTSALVAGGLLMTSKWLLLGAAALVTAAGVGWFVHSNSVQPATAVSAPVVNAHDLHVPNQAAAVDAPTAERNEVVPARSGAVAEAAKSPAPGWWLIGDVAGVSETDRAQLSSPSNEIWSAEIVGTHFEIDLAQLFAAQDLGVRIDRLRGVDPRDSNEPASGKQGAAAELRKQLRAKVGPAPSTFVARYDQVRFMPMHVLVDVDAQLATTALTAASERVELHVQFAPQPATLIAEGRVIAPAELDASEVVVALYAINAHGWPTDPPEEAARCSKDGAFRARCASSGAHALALVPPGMRPATRVFDADVHGRVDVGEVTLERGEHLSGVVESDPTAMTGAFDVTARPLVGPWIGLTDPAPRAGARPSRTGDLTWFDDRFEWGAHSATTSADGQFRIDGLAMHDYGLRVSSRSPPGAVEQNSSVYLTGRDGAARATATREGLVLRSSEHCIRLDVRSGDRPLDGASVWIITEKNTGAGADAEGHIIDVHWDGAANATIRVSKEGYAPGIVVASAKDAVPGAIRVVELTRDASLASLVLRPIVPCGIDSDGYSVQLAPLVPDPTRSNEPWVEKDFSLRDSEWRFDGVAADRYRVDVRAHPKPKGTSSWCVPPILEVELKPGEAAVRELPFVSGGRLAITVRDEHAVTTTTVLSGGERMMWFTYFDPHTGRTEQRGGSAITAPIGARAELAEPFEPGPLALTITRDTPDHAKRERTVNIVPGQVTELVVDFSKPDER